MSHTIDEKEKLILRIKRIHGQLKATEKALAEEADCSKILHNLMASKGAMESLIFEVLKGHVFSHILDPNAKPKKEQLTAANELMEAIKTYLK